jgi:hypothetical protein
VHSTQENREKDPGLSQFKFTWKLHAAVCHLCDQALNSGHAQQSSDCWVERLMRQQACQICKCATKYFLGGGMGARPSSLPCLLTWPLCWQAALHRHSSALMFPAPCVLVQGQSVQGYRECHPAGPRRQPQRQGNGGGAEPR